MLIKILFTLAVAAGVVVFFRARRGRGAGVAEEGRGDTGARDEGGSVSPRVLAYALLGVLATVSAGLFALHQREGNRIVHIRVISDGATADYQARRKSIAGRNFTTLDGARVTLGVGERIEMVEP